MGALSFKTKITIVLLVFTLALCLQIVAMWMQTTQVVEPMNESQGRIREVSALIGEADRLANELADFRWGYSDPAALLASIGRAEERLTTAGLDPSPVSNRDMYHLESAIAATTGSLKTSLAELSAALHSDSGAAADIYYGETSKCLGYLMNYLQDYLEACADNERARFSEITQLQRRMSVFSSISVGLSMIIAVVVCVYMIRLVQAVTRMGKASEAISRGDFNIDDIEVGGADEFGRMEEAFNTMKNSLRGQMELLEERNRMEAELHKKDTEALSLQAALEREKLDQLRSRVNPHFLFNTLNAVMGKAEEEGAAETSRLLTALSRLFRSSLASVGTLSPLSEEIRILTEYHSLIGARFGAKIGFTWRAVPGIDLTTTLAPSFIIQPLVENAIKHGLAKKEDGGVVSVVVGPMLDGGRIMVTVKDDGVGMSPGKLEETRKAMEGERKADGSHTGLHTTAKRLELSQEGCGLEIYSEEGVGTTVVATVPCRVEEEEDEDCVQDSDRR